MFANGNIRKYQIIVGSITILNLPISILFLYFGYQPQITLIISIFISLLALQVRLQMLKTMVSLPVKKYYSKVILIVVAVSLVSLIAPMFISFYMTPNLIRLIVNSFVCFFSIFGSIYFIGITKYERNIINNKIKAIVLKK
jgi:hypothetical protein